MKIYNIFRVIHELWRERYLGDERTNYLKYFLAWLVHRKCGGYHDQYGRTLYIDTMDVCHICDGTGIDYRFSFRKLINIFENTRRDIDIKIHERRMGQVEVDNKK